MVILTGGPRRLLQRFHEIMQEEGGVQHRLDSLVSLIAISLVADACAIYLHHMDGSLSLLAAKGLSGAAFKFWIKEGEGLISLVAQTGEMLILSDAQADPHFAPQPELGDEQYNSILAVPIVRDGFVRGVLTIQNRARVAYSEEEAEALQTIALVLAEIIPQGSMISISEPTGHGAVPGRSSIPEAWSQERDRVLERLEGISSVLDRLLPLVTILMQQNERSVGIGDNFPPEPIDPMPLQNTTISEAIVATHVLQDELQSEKPAHNAIRLAELVLKRMGHAANEFSKWVGAKFDAFSDAFAQSAGKEVGKWFGRAITAAAFYEVIAHLFANLTTITAHIETFLSLL